MTSYQAAARIAAMNTSASAENGRVMASIATDSAAAPMLASRSARAVPRPGRRRSTSRKPIRSRSTMKVRDSP
jgi:hypothetical protein